MKRSRPKYEKPSHPWEKNRMDAEDKLRTQFGFRRKREIWRAQTILRKLRHQARYLLAKSGPQAELETKQMIGKLWKFGLVGKNATLDDVLGLTVEKILERYLQIVIQRKGLVKTPSQARQFILHGHVKVSGRKVNVPSYLVSTAEEPLIEVAKIQISEGPAPAPAPAPAAKAEGE